MRIVYLLMISFIIHFYANGANVNSRFINFKDPSGTLISFTVRPNTDFDDIRFQLIRLLISQKLVPSGSLIAFRRENENSFHEKINLSDLMDKETIIIKITNPNEVTKAEDIENKDIENKNTVNNYLEDSNKKEPVEEFIRGKEGDLTPLKFGRLNIYFQPIISSHPGMVKLDNSLNQTVNEYPNPDKVIAPKSDLLKRITKFKKFNENSWQRINKNSFLKNIPSSYTTGADKFDFFTSLNVLQLTLPSDFFLKDTEILEKIGSSQIGTGELDTTLSLEGLNAFMNFYGKEKDLTTGVLTTIEDFKQKFDLLFNRVHQHPVAILLQFDQSLRHSSGLLLKKNLNGIVEAFIYDSMGLDLPAHPCGMRGYKNSQNKSIIALVEYLISKNVSTFITPINMRIALQKDFYSCFFSTILFFEAIHKDDFQNILNQGFARIYGKDINISSSKFYAINYLPLLAGVQDDLALLLMTDALDNFSFNELAFAKANWTKVNRYNEASNVFWQAGYVELLRWFNNSYQKKNEPFPDFKTLALSSSQSRDSSALEKYISGSLIPLESPKSAFINSNTSPFNLYSLFYENIAKNNPYKDYRFFFEDAKDALQEFLKNNNLSKEALKNIQIKINISKDHKIIEKSDIQEGMYEELINNYKIGELLLGGKPIRPQNRHGIPKDFIGSLVTELVPDLDPSLFPDNRLPVIYAILGAGKTKSLSHFEKIQIKTMTDEETMFTALEYVKKGSLNDAVRCIKKIPNYSEKLIAYIEIATKYYFFPQTIAPIKLLIGTKEWNDYDVIQNLAKRSVVRHPRTSLELFNLLPEDLSCQCVPFIKLAQKNMATSKIDINKDYLFLDFINNKSETYQEYSYFYNIIYDKNYSALINQLFLQKIEGIKIHPSIIFETLHSGIKNIYKLNKIFESKEHFTYKNKAIPRFFLGNNIIIMKPHLLPKQKADLIKAGIKVDLPEVYLVEKKSAFDRRQSLLNKNRLEDAEIVKEFEFTEEDHLKESEPENQKKLQRALCAIAFNNPTDAISILNSLTDQFKNIKIHDSVSDITVQNVIENLTNELLTNNSFKK